MNALAPALTASPEAYPYSLDPAADTLSFVRLTEQDYADASFLDARMLGPRAPEAAPWVEVERAAAGLPERLGLIFHIGHVGSTLLSRLLGAHPGVLALREPLPLRTLAQSEADVDARLAVLLPLWSRTFCSDQLSVVKATSFCCDLAWPILQRPSRPRAVFIFTRPEVYLATLFAGENNHLDIRGAAELRARRLNRRLGGPVVDLASMSYAQTAAVSWACEMAALADAAKASDDQVLWLDFERLLARPQARLAAAFVHLGVAADPAEIARIVAGPELGRYSKAPEHAYDADLRARVLNQARGSHRDQIAGGLAWIEAAAAEHPAIAAALNAGSI